MFWQEDIKEENFTIPDDVQDVVFNIHSKILPMDHAYLLSQAILKQLPWLKDDECGVFDISVADGNGWKQNKTDGFYYPSKRSKLIIRMPKSRIRDANSIVGKTLDLGEYEVNVIKTLKPKLLSDMSVVFAKHVAFEEGTSEDEFLQNCYNELRDHGINVKKMLAGLESSIKTNDRVIHTRSLMIANLRKPESVLIQEKGIGKYRTLGCGLFLPHKDIEDSSES